MNLQRKEKLVLSATNYARKHLGINDTILVFINDGKVFKSTKHSALYEIDLGIIRYNKDWLKTASTERILRCAFYEVFIARIHLEILGHQQGTKSTLFSEEEFMKLEQEFKNSDNGELNKVEKRLSSEFGEAYAEILYQKYLNR